MVLLLVKTLTADAPMKSVLVSGAAVFMAQRKRGALGPRWLCYAIVTRLQIRKVNVVPKGVLCDLVALTEAHVLMLKPAVRCYPFVEKRHGLLDGL